MDVLEASVRRLGKQNAHIVQQWQDAMQQQQQQQRQHSKHTTAAAASQMHSESYGLSELLATHKHKEAPGAAAVSSSARASSNGRDARGSRGYNSSNNISSHNNINNHSNSAGMDGSDAGREPVRRRLLSQPLATAAGASGPRGSVPPSPGSSAGGSMSVAGGMVSPGTLARVLRAASKVDKRNKELKAALLVSGMGSGMVLSRAANA